MSDLIRRDDVLRSIEEWYGKLCKPESITGLADVLAGFSAYKEILMIPVVDAVAVVRCKECNSYNGHRYCTYLDETVLDDDFCSFGERREGNGVD